MHECADAFCIDPEQRPGAIGKSEAASAASRAPMIDGA
jgi:hypothetical protein